MKLNDESLAGVQQFSRDIEPDGLSAIIDDERVLIQDEDGEPLFHLPDPLFLSIVELPQAEIVEILGWVRSLIRSNWDAGHRRGVRAGRDQVTETVQQLLGLDRIAAALEARIPK